MDLHPCLFCLSFYLLYFFLPPFEDNGLLFWVPDVLCWHSEVVLWNLLSVQMFFWWICGGESGLPILFLCHLSSHHYCRFLMWCSNIFLFLAYIFYVNVKWDHSHYLILEDAQRELRNHWRYTERIWRPLLH